MHIAVIGVGINGACTAWELTRAGHRVRLFERDSAMAHTSCSSTKLLHGGLRYLENGEFRLVREALIERRAWFADAPQHTRPLQLTLPICRTARRPRWLVGLGLSAYDILALGSGLQRHDWQSREATIRKNPQLRAEGLLGAFIFWDGQMDDLQLGLWVGEQAKTAGAQVYEHTSIKAVNTSGEVHFDDGRCIQFDRVVSATGPWASRLLTASQLNSQHSVDLVCSSHIVLNRPCINAYILEITSELHIFFVLPWQGQTLVGTTEVRQSVPLTGIPVTPGTAEINYLLSAYNYFFEAQAGTENISASDAGLRPMVTSALNPSRATREYAFERHGKLITIFGCKWTTARALARNIKKTLCTQ